MRPCVALLLLFLTLAPLRAQTDDAPTPKLSAALAAARPPSNGLALTVGAEDVYLTNGASNPRLRAEIGQIADAFGRVTRRFGSILALAPPTMFVFNSSPGDADPLADLRPTEALTRLSASLSPVQWAALTGASGLGLSDLTSPEQRGLFSALFPGKITVARKPPPYNPKAPDIASETKDLDAERGQIKLHLGIKPHFTITVKSDGSDSFMMIDDTNAAGSWQFFAGEGQRKPGSLYGVSLRESVPNAPKRADLNFDAPQSAVSVPIKDVKTVGELLARIGQTTKTELYVDALWEKKSVTIMGAAATAKASDLLRALAYCLTGTYRKIGPAYVLTENILGRATLRQIWSDWSRKVDAERRGPMSDAMGKLAARHAYRDLNALTGGLTLTDEQKKRRSFALLADSGVPFSTLPPEQKKALQNTLPSPEPGGSSILTPATKIVVTPTVGLQFTAPGLDGPVEINDLSGGFDLDFLGMNNLEPTPEEQAKMQAETDAAVVKPTPKVNLTTLLQSVPKRAVLAAPRTIKDVNALLVSMKSLGFNQLWLDVFSGGVAHLPGVPLSDLPLVSNAGPDVLDEAIAKGRALGIAVFASFDLLRWGENAPASLADMSVLGETSPIADARERERQAAELPDMMPELLPPAPRGVLVSPLSVGVRENLTDLIHAVAVRPNLAGLIWRDTAAIGYVPVSDASPNALGFSEPMRLAFLRLAHADPLDLMGESGEMLDIILRGGTFDGGGVSYFADTSEDDRAMTARWQQFRQNANLSLLRALWNAVPPATPKRPRLPIVVKQRRPPSPHDFGDDWYASWDSRAAAPPAFRSFMDGGDAPYQDSSTQARRARASFFLVPPSIPITDAAACAEALGWRLQNGTWRGLVLDVTGEENAGEKTNANPLAKLAESAKNQSGKTQKGGVNAGK